MRSRRAFLAATCACLAASIVPSPLPAAPPAWQERVLWLSRPSTDEEVRVPFCRDGYTVYLPGYRAICWLLRDHHVDPAEGYVAFSIDTIEALWEIQQTLLLQGVRRPLVVTSGYRTAWTNAHTDGAVHNSQHVQKTAVDMYVDGVSMHGLFGDCYSRAISGGIGEYADHVHLDTGPRRYWVGDLDESARTIDLADVGSLAGRRVILA